MGAFVKIFIGLLLLVALYICYALAKFFIEIVLENTNRNIDISDDHPLIYTFLSMVCSILFSIIDFILFIRIIVLLIKAHINTKKIKEKSNHSNNNINEPLIQENSEKIHPCLEIPMKEIYSYKPLVDYYSYDKSFYNKFLIGLMFLFTLFLLLGITIDFSHDELGKYALLLLSFLFYLSAVKINLKNYPEYGYKKGLTRETIDLFLVKFAEFVPRIKTDLDIDIVYKKFIILVIK